MIDLAALQETFARKILYYTVHAQEQMAVRQIRDVEIREAILGQQSSIIEQYPKDKYSPSCLVYGVTKSGRILHVQTNDQGVMITVYEPDLVRWQDDLKTRRR